MGLFVSIAHASEKAAEEGGVSLADLLFGPHSLVYWSALSFFIVLTILSRFAYKPILETLDKRSEKIKEAIDQAENLRTEADQLFRAYEQRIKDAQGEAQKLINEGREAGDRLKNEIIKDSEVKAQQILEGAQAAIGQERDKAISVIQDQVAQLTVQVAAKVIGKTLTPQEHERLIEESLAEIGGKSGV